MAEEHCVICWAVIQEGRMVCPACYRRVMAEVTTIPQEKEKGVNGKMINWKVRIANKNFWLAFIPAVLLLVQTVMAVFGVALDFGELGNKLTAVVEAVFLVLGIVGIVNDPTTDGLKDSQRAMTYQEPYKDSTDED